MGSSYVRLRSRGLVAAVVLLGLGVPSSVAGGAPNETETVTRTVPMNAGGTLRIRNFSGRIAVTGSDRTDVTVNAVRRAPRERLDRIKLDIRSEGGDVVIEANKRDDDRRHDDNVVETDLTIEMPQRGNLDINAFSSPVVVRNVSGTEHRVKTFSGDQQLERLAGPVDAETFSARIALQSPSWTEGERLLLKTFSGDIELRLPSDAGGSVEFDSFSGDFASDVPLTLRGKEKRKVRAELPGKATGSVQLKTFSGDVRILK